MCVCRRACVTDCALFHTLIICGAFMTRTRTLAGTVMRPRRCCRANRFPTGAPRCVSAASPGIITGWRGRASVAPSQTRLLAERRAEGGRGSNNWSTERHGPID